MKKLDKKVVAILIIALVIVVISVAVAIYSMNRCPKKVENVDVPQDNQEQQEVIDETRVPQDKTTVSDEYVDDNGNVLSEEQIEQIKSSLLEEFKTYGVDKLGLENVDLASDMTRLMYNVGVTTILEKKYLVFNVYALAEGDSYLRNRGMYAMSLDLSRLYKFDTESLVYLLIEK